MSAAADAAHLDLMTDSTLDLSLALGLGPTPVRIHDNADPHPVILTVHPRDVVVGQTGCTPRRWEAEYEINVEHPETCSGYIEDCPVAEYLEVIGIDRDLYAPFPEPDFMTDEDLAVLDGTFLHVTMTRHYSRWDSPNGAEYDVEYDFVWDI